VVGLGKANPFERLAQLQVSRVSGWTPQPDWLRFYFGLGAEFANGDAAMDGALVVPTSRIAAAAICAGAVISRATRNRGLSADTALHIEMLKSLRPNAPVSLVRGDRFLKGWYRGTRTGPTGQALFGVQLESKGSGALTRWLDATGALRIQPIQEEVALPESQKGKRLKGESDLVRHLFGPMAESFSNGSSQDVIVVGPRGSLEDDLDSVALRAPSGSRDTGVLRDLTRIRGVGGGNRSFRADRLSSRVKAVEVQSNANPFVIFNGGDAFLRARHLFVRFNSLVVIDRTEASFQQTTDTVLQSFQGRGVTARVWAHPSPPLGVELLLFGKAHVRAA
jgi:hypothetical protein